MILMSAPRAPARIAAPGLELDAVDLTGQQCLVRERAVLHRDDLKLEAMPRCKVALANHEHEAGIALRLDHHVFPRLQVRGGCGTPEYSYGQDRETSSHHRRSSYFSFGP